MGNIISGYKHIIWDWNGTLLDDADVSVEVMNRLLKRRNMPPLTVDKYKEIIDFPIIKYYIRLGFDFSLEPFDKISVEFIQEYNNSCKSTNLHHYAEAVLGLFKSSGLSQSILSAAHQDYLEWYVTYFGIRDYFIGLIGLDHIHATSKIDNGRRWLEQLPYTPEEVLLIGDTVHDYEVSREIGCDCILVANGHHSINRLKNCSCKIHNSLNSIFRNEYEALAT